MHILIVNNTKIPVYGYGGTERIIWWLGKRLNELGHKVTYLVAQGSECDFAKCLIYDEHKAMNQQIPKDVDVVHFQFEPKDKPNKPYLITHHGNYHPHDDFDANTVFISENHAHRNKSECFVYNGIDIEEYGKVDFTHKRKYLLFLGWANRPEKNLKDCIYFARKTKNVLAVVGGQDKWFKRRPWVQYKGFIGGEAKLEILRSTKALLFPVLWHEPFGLALLESLYFGAPVIGTPYGSLPELVPHSVGYLSNKRSDLVKSLENIDQFDPKKCHEYVCDQFTHKHMTDNYLQLYEQVIAGKSLNGENPVNQENFKREQLLPIYV